MNETIPVKAIQQKILLVRGYKVMLDKDLAVLYGGKPIRLREQVKRNIRRFPRDFMFQLNQQEVDLKVSQNAIPSRKHLGGHNPYVFTEQGVAMLASKLDELERKIEKHDEEIHIIFEAIRQLMAPPEKKLDFPQIDGHSYCSIP